ncbi:MAG TPA: S8 family peptidase [Gammaproteobacteria bacterium]|nr:S8 family peptidase [Gammaproteobacteria bacterium]
MLIRKTRHGSGLGYAGLMASVIMLTSTALYAAPRDRYVEPAEPRLDGSRLEALRSGQIGPAQRLIVKFKDDGTMNASKREARLQQAMAKVGAELGVKLEKVRTLGTGAELIKVQGGRADMMALARRFAADPNVEYAEEDRLLKPLLTPNDTRYNEQWHYYESTAGIRLPTAWDITNGSGVYVAVLDTGYRPHADLAANIVGGYDMISDTFVANDGNGRDSDAQDPGDWVAANECGGTHSAQNSSWHGTHVAGTVAAVTNNASGVAGVAYGAKVVPVRVLGKCGGYTSDIADGIIWASGGSVSGVPANPYPAKVINMSLGGSGACDSTTQAAINSARSRGTTVVVAAGNENTNASNSSPANCSGVVTVAAVNRSGGRAYYSNYGTVVDVAAPGGDVRSSASNGILSTLNTGTTTPGSDSYAFYQGTSMATPHVAGVAALLYARKSTATPDEIENTLKSTARAFPASCSGCGTGIVDATAALNAISGGGGGGGSTELQDGVAVTNLSGSAGTELRFTMNVPSGQSTLTFTMSGGTGDADLYVKFGTAPTTSSYDCRPYLGGNNESCSFNNPAAGTWHVMVRGYSSFSGVSLVGDYAASSGGSCPSGFTTYTNSLSGTGASKYEPNGSYYYSSVSGTHSGRLSGPSGTDFDLYIQKWNGSSWGNVKSSTGSTSTESIDYSGTSGYYRWRIYSYSGSGTYTFCLKKP